jgi:hypothetical protein
MFTNMSASFATVCNLTGLEVLSAFNLSPDIDALAEGWRKADIPFAMTIPLSEFKDMFPALQGPPTAATTVARPEDDDSASSSAEGASQRSSPKSQHDAGDPDRSSLGDNSPAVPVSTALSMHNCPAVPVGSKPDTGNGEADPRYHRQESATFMSDAQGPKTPHVEAAAGKASPWINHRGQFRCLLTFPR